MKRLTKIMAMAILLLGLGCATAGAYSFTDYDGNWWAASGGATIGTGDIGDLLIDLADGSLDDDYSGWLTGGGTVLSGVDPATGSYDGNNFSLTAGGAAVGGDASAWHTLNVGDTWFHYDVHDVSFENFGLTTVFSLDMMFFQEDLTGNYVYAGLGLDSVSLGSLQYPQLLASLANLLCAGCGDIDLGNLELAASGEVDVIYGQHCVPIPGAIWLLGSGLVGLVGIRRRRG